MEPEQYDILFRRESSHWWYTGMRRAALALLETALERAVQPRILDAGCGTGGTTIALRRFGGPVFGIDLSRTALHMAETRDLGGRIVQGSVERLPFGSATFDVVTSFEVVYHAGVGSDQQALREFRRVLRPGGILLLRLPAHDWLRGRHDRLVHTRHRYTRREVQRKLLAAGFTPDYVSWANSILFLPAAVKRLLEGVMPATPPAAQQDSEPDLWQPPAWLNHLLEECLAVEALLLPRRAPLPVGLSVIALARAG